jgi:hypothetical protein
MESIFLILSGVILVAGILYWFWSHIQLTQKKVQLIENAMFELRSMVAAGGPPAQAPASPLPQPVYKDLADDDWAEEAPAPEQKSSPAEWGGEGSVQMVEAPIQNIEALIAEREAEREIPLAPAPDELKPGGRIEVANEEETQSGDQFRELFMSKEAAPKSPESLDAMPVKELRRLAEQRGIAGADGLRKKELLAALRQQIQPTATLDVEVTEEEATILE